MTLLIAWAAVDTHGTSSTYIASDSRISWGKTANFDHGRKVFAFKSHPDVLGYCGDVLFPSIALNQIIELGDAGLLFEPHWTGQEKFQAIVDKLNDLFRSYPRLHAGLEDNSLSVIHASRQSAGADGFSCNTILWTRRTGWGGQTSQLPTKSDVLFVLGTASAAFSKNLVRYRKGPNAGTSRSIFHCFCDTLANSGDATIGGAPQLVGIIRKPGSAAQSYGIIHGNQRTYLGAHIDNLRNFDSVAWRNENFELCDGRTGKKLPDAQAQPDPLRRQ